MRRFLLVSILLLFLLTSFSAFAEDELTITADQIVGHSPHTVTVTAPADGTVSLRVTSAGQLYHAENAVAVHAGENSITWDAIGPCGEPLPASMYTLEISFTGTDGRQLTAETTARMQEIRLAVLYVLPTADVLYRDGPAWQLQFELTKSGRMSMEIVSASDPDTVIDTLTFSYSREKVTSLTRTVTWDASLRGGRLQAGDYLLRCHAGNAETQTVTVPVTVVDGKPETLPVQVTGPVMPSRSASDEEIWAMMMQPAAVPLAEERNLVDLYESPTKHKVVGSIYGRTTSLEIFSIENGWARVGAWSKRGNYVEGYVQTSRLKMVQPDDEYGLLIDKQAQTLTVFREGQRIGTMKISTGLRTRSNRYAETCAGSYITGSRIPAFNHGSAIYDYPIRISGYNLLHSHAWVRSGKTRNYDKETDLLGGKASAGCVRIQRFSEDGGLTVYWLWSNIRVNTRVILLDDPLVRAEESAALKGIYYPSDMPYTGTGTNSWD